MSEEQVSSTTSSFPRPQASIRYRLTIALFSSVDTDITLREDSMSSATNPWTAPRAPYVMQKAHRRRRCEPTHSKQNPRRGVSPS